MSNREHNSQAGNDNTGEHPVAPAPRPEKDPQGKKLEGVDESVIETFPASDPPSSWAGRDLTPQEREEQAAQQAATRANQKQ